MGKYYEGIYNAEYKTQYSDVDEACETITSNPCSVFAEEVETIYNKLDSLDFTNWDDDGRKSFDPAKQNAVDSFKKIHTSITTVFDGAEKTYQSLQDQLKALSQADSSYKTLKASEPNQYSDIYQKTYTLSDGTVRSYTSSSYYVDHASWKNKIFNLEKKCEEMIDNIDKYTSALEDINGLGVDDTYDFAGLPSVTSFENTEFVYVPKNLDINVETVTDEEIKKFNLPADAVKVKVGDRFLYFEANSEDMISIVQEVQNIPPAVIDKLGWDYIFFGEGRVYSKSNGRGEFCGGRRFDDGIIDISGWVAFCVSEVNTESDIGRFTDNPNFASDLDTYLRDPSVRLDPQYKYITDLIENNFEGEKVVRNNDDIVEDYLVDLINSGKTVNQLDADAPISERGIAEAEELAGKILSYNNKDYQPTKYEINNYDDSFEVICDKVTSNGGVIVFDNSALGGSVVYQTEDGCKCVIPKLRQQYDGIGFNGTFLAIEDNRHPMHSTITVYSNEDLSDIEGCHKVEN